MTLELHHIAYVVDDLAESVRHWEENLGARIELPATLVSAHGVLVTFLKIAEARIELVQPVRPDAATGTRRREPGSPDHLAFYTSEFDQRIEQIRSNDGILVRGPVASEAFDGKRICFVFYNRVGLVELIER